MLHSGHMESEKKRPQRASWGVFLFALLAVPLAVAIGAYRLLADNTLDFEALRTAATVGAGAGGLVTLGAVLHRQRLQIRDQAHREQVARDNKHDAEEKRATELYMKAVEQLGHAAAPVRIGALHALDALGRDHPHRREAVMDVWCAYLRIPPVGNAPEWPQDELQVRLTVQRLIAKHLRPATTAPARERTTSIRDEFWGMLPIDLTEAHLHQANFDGCHFDSPRFHRAVFHDGAGFSRAHFTGDAGFTGAVLGDAWFEKAVFKDRASFDRVSFNGHTYFLDAQFDGTLRLAGSSVGGTDRHRTPRDIARLLGITQTAIGESEDEQAPEL